MKLLICYFLVVVIAISFGIHHSYEAQKHARQFISDCKAAGGVPVYDLCAVKAFKIIKLAGYDFAGEVNEY